MPQLTRLRFINVGHDNARMKDLIINLSNEQNHPLNSMLLLRNGGGKSSLLSLFFSLINPRKSNFPGVGGRVLKDYVQTGDHSIVVAEWKLDTEPNDEPIWYLTGGFYEERNEIIERLFFSARVCDPDITFENLPFRNEDGQRVRKNIFKQSWQNLAVKYPQADVRETETLHEWQSILESERIDPELFNYQIRMNSYEGGADELFRFKDSDQFIDFFINVAITPDKSNEISANLKKFSDFLRRRKYQLIPELELISRLKQPMKAMIAVAKQQSIFQKEAGELQSNLERLREIVINHLSTLILREKQIAELRRIALDTQQKNLHKIEFKENKMLSFQRILLEHRAERFADNQEKLIKKQSQTEYEYLLWQAMIPLSEIERQEEKMHELEKLLRIQNKALKPDLEAVQAVASDYASALLWRMNKNRQLAHIKTEEANVHRTKASKTRQTGKDARDESVRIKTEAKHKAKQIEQAQNSRTDLKKSKTIELDELIEAADLRWQQKMTELKSEEIQIKSELQIVEEKLDLNETNLNHTKQQLFELQHDLKTFQEKIEQATIKQNELLTDEVLYKVLEDVDTAALNFSSLTRINRVRNESETQLRELKAEIVENEIVFEYLRSHSLLPPIRDVRTILQILAKEGITAWAGWEHASECFAKNEDARNFIDKHPEIVQGVLVRDEHFQKAQLIIEKASVNLTSAVMIGAKSLALNGQASLVNEKRIVVGPTSDGHFNKNAAKNEEIILESHLQQKHQQFEEIKLWIVELRKVAEKLEQFISHYPSEWLTQQRAELLDVEENLEKCNNQINNLENEKKEKLAQTAKLKNKLEHYSDERHITEEHLNRLKTHRNLHGTDEDIINLEKEKVADERHAENLLYAHNEQEKLASDEENKARKLDEEAKDLIKDASRDESSSRNIKYVGENILPKIGDVNSLRERHQILRELIDEKSGGDHLQIELKQSENLLNNSREEYDKKFENRISEKEVRKMLLTIADKSSLNSKSENILNEVIKLSEFVGTAKSENQTAQSLLNQHRNDHGQLKYLMTDEEQNLMEAELEQEAQTAKSEMEEARSKTRIHEQEISRLNEESSELKLHKYRLETQQNLIDDFLTDIELFRHCEKTATQFLETDLSEKQITERLEKVKNQVASARQKQTEIRNERQNTYRRIFNQIGESIFDFAKELRMRDEENLEQEADLLLNELEIREKNVQEALEGCNTHRNLLIVDLSNIADTGIKMLRSLANDSKLPESAGTLAKQPFLKIKLNNPELPERQQLIGNLLDTIIAEEKVPNGITLLQRAVRKLSHPITVQVLFPDTESPPRYVRITEMSKESGGEGLTSAVLLYCALAQKRAKERGSKINVSGVLLLDNPIGKVNRRQFLELQRETARAMNIQLIYATGVKDYEAIRILPNLVQLRNERRNKNQSLLEAVRVMRPEENLD